MVSENMFCSRKCNNNLKFIIDFWHFPKIAISESVEQCQIFFYDLAFIGMIKCTVTNKRQSDNTYDNHKQSEYNDIPCSLCPSVVSADPQHPSSGCVSTHP